jgi:hypothetical protein
LLPKFISKTGLLVKTRPVLQEENAGLFLESGKRLWGRKLKNLLHSTFTEIYLIQLNNRGFDEGSVGKVKIRFFSLIRCELKFCTYDLCLIPYLLGS